MPMASSQLPIASSKVTNAPPQAPPLISQSSSSGAVDNASRRAGGSGTFGAGQAARSSGGAPRNKQISKNQHKQSRRYRLTDEDALAESAAMRSFTNRKGQTSITHLMNFSLPPRPSYRDHQHGNHRHIRRNPTWGLGSGYHAIDKARYVHANYRFVVDPRRDYHVQSIDADVHLDWSNVLQIIASPQSQNASCPICLGEPVAPRMAKCGHIFCLHCLIRYMHSSEEVETIPEKRPRWKKCPICWDSIYISETRPVRWYIGQECPPPVEGEDIVLRLVMRPAGSTLALPGESSAAMSKDDEIPWHFAADVMDYARVMRGTEDYMVEQFDTELAAIRELEKHDELMFGEDTEWTGKAIRSINDAKEKMMGIGNAPLQARKPEETSRPKRKPIIFNEDEDLVPEMYSRKHDSIQFHHVNPRSKESEGADIQDSTNTSALSKSLAEFRASQGGQQHAPADYHFYQALMHYYLSSLDIRILKAAFGDYSLFPSTILPRVERISSGHVVDDELRKRTKYLAHLPHGCEVTFLECNWTDTVPAEVLEKFKPEIEKRRKRNLEKTTKEEKERARAEKEEEDKRYASARRMRRPNSPTERFRPDDFAPLGVAQQELLSASAEAGGEATFPSWQGRGGSFASLASPSTSPSHARTVWGTAAIAPSSPELPAAIAANLGSQDDGWLQGWETDLMREDQLVAQVAAASLNGESSSSAPPPSGQSKKKKSKKITLMSTNARRGA